MAFSHGLTAPIAKSRNELAKQVISAMDLGKCGVLTWPCRYALCGDTRIASRLILMPSKEVTLTECDDGFAAMLQ